MQGALGIGANLNKWSDQDAALATRMVALYKRVRNTVQTGDLYRLLSPSNNDVTANEYVAGDRRQAVLFAFRHSQQYRIPAPTIGLRGLDERSVYRVESLDGKTQELSGAYLMRNGVDLDLRGDYDSTIVILDRQ
jgi:alpha-galactosidase